MNVFNQICPPFFKPQGRWQRTITERQPALARRDATVGAFLQLEIDWTWPCGE